MKIAIFWHDILHYHVARIAALLQLAERTGHTVQAFILCSAYSELPSFEYHTTIKDKVKILSEEPSVAGEFSRHSKRQLLTELDRFNPDVVAIIGYTGCVSRGALAWCRYHRRGAILMLSSHATDYKRVWWKEWPKARLVRLYDAAFVSGKPQAAYAQQLGVPPERIVSGYGVVDNDFWRDGAALARANPVRWRTDLAMPEHFFLTACRFVPKKNLTGLLNAYAKYVAQAGSTPWALVIVGDGNLAPLLQQQVAELNLADLVHFPGYLPADEMATLYGLASAFVLASAYAEQWGLVVNEAMAAGLPVLVSQICGCVSDLVIEGKTGFTFDPSKEEQLAELFLNCSTGKLEWSDMGRQAQAHIQHYSPEHFAHNLFAAAQMAIKHARSRRWQSWPSPSFWV
ncbi:MAG: glycosyltransferase family 4 protein [Ardenticatenaceae bacterium]